MDRRRKKMYYFATLPHRKVLCTITVRNEQLCAGCYGNVYNNNDIVSKPQDSAQVSLPLPLLYSHFDFHSLSNLRSVHAPNTLTC